MAGVLADLSAFRKDLTALVNKHNLDTVCRTPDYAIADFLVHTVANLSLAMMEHDKHQPSGFNRTGPNKPTPVKLGDEV